jgi:hypothetical protein
MVFLVVEAYTDVSEKHVASVSLANFKVQVSNFLDAYTSNLKVEEVRSSETSISGYKTTRCHNREDYIHFGKNSNLRLKKRGFMNSAGEVPVCVLSCSPCRQYRGCGQRCAIVLHF